jgi:hypothetical protein
MRPCAMADGAALRFEEWEAAAEGGGTGLRTAPPHPPVPRRDAIAEAAALRWLERESD